ncbi:FecR domain-containing protein [Chloroflexota bacterium]
MGTKLDKVLDKCLARINSGEAISVCLAEYPHLHRQLVPLLHTALSIVTMPKLAPCDEFRRASKGRLMARLSEMLTQAEKSPRLRLVTDGLGALWRGLGGTITGPARVAVPLTLVLVLALQGLYLFSTASSLASSSAPAFTSLCTLSTSAGNVQLQASGSSTWQEVENGMTIETGSRIKTDPNSQALLTFFNGTTIKLEPGTDLVVKQVEGGAGNEPTIIVLKQWLGRTWSQVAKLAGPDSHYEIQTPSASALVRGTVFTTEVDETGATRVQTLEGLVSVSAQGDEVYLPAGQQTTVGIGTSPSEPAPINPEKSEGSPEKSEEEMLALSLDNEGPSSQEQDERSIQGLESEQGNSIGTIKGLESEPSRDYMWWIIMSILLISFGLTALMWRMQ